MRTSTPGIAAYTPRILREWLRFRPDERSHTVDASLAFVDISGFTQLSESLSRRGRVGAEELTDTINACFARLLSVAYDNGGSLLKFGGDALLLMFTGDEHPTAATRAAVGMRRALAEIGRLETPDGPVTLEMSTGVHTGTFHLFLVGGSHRELIITGPGASETVRAEAAAAAGDVLVSGDLACCLPGEALGDAKGPGHLLVAAPPGTDRWEEPAAPHPAHELGIPIGLRTQASAAGTQPEHRRVTVAFLRFQGLDALIRDEGPAVAAEELDALVRDVQGAIDPRGVTFLGTDVDQDGGKIILAAGAPVSTGNDEERMLLALREIVRTDRAVAVHIGVNTDHVFAGDIGPHYRRAYTVMGDGVNLAARLMGKAGVGEVLATEPVLDRSRTTFEAVALEPFLVKGKSEPVRALRVGDASGSRVEEGLDRLPLVGRDEELRTLTDLLRAVRAGVGQLVEVVGEPGIGKTRLVEALRADAAGAGIHSVACELYEASTPYAPFRRLLRATSGIPEGATDAAAAGRLGSIVARAAPELEPWLPLIAIPFAIELPPTEEIASLDAQFRRQRLHETMFELLRATWTEPVAIILEDAQWMDEASADLLRYLSGRVGEVPWVIASTRRPVDGGFTPDGETPSARIALGPLDTAATRQLAHRVTEDSPLPDHELGVLIERSGGNPLFLQELIAATQEAGGLGGLPDSVEAVVTARIDQLPPTSRTLLRHLSVLGQSANVDLAACVLPTGTDVVDDDAWNQLASFLSRERGTIRFRSTLIRDAAYHGLPFRDRRRLHANVGDSLARPGDGDDDSAELLSYHYLLAERYEESWRHSLTAAERAARIYANVEASRFYRRALESADALEDIASSAISETWEQLGSTLERLGEFDRAEEAYRQSLALLDPNPAAEARLLLKQAQARVWLDDYEHALELIGNGLELIENADDEPARQQRAQLLAWYATFSQAQGRHETAVAWADRAIEEATAADDRDALAHSYKTLDLVYMELRQPENAVYSQRALELYEELDDVPNQAVVLNNMGAIAYLQSRWDEARRLYERAVDLYERVGNGVGACFGRYNIAEILTDQGYVTQAEELFVEVERVWRASGFLNGIAYARLGRGRIAAAVQHYDDALDLFNQARSGWKEIGADARVIDADARIAECYLLRSEPDVAIAITDEVLAHAEGEAEDVPQAALLHRLRGYAFLQRGEFNRARESLAISLREAEEHDSHYEAALTKRAISDLLCRDGGDDTDLRQESRTVLTRLGVIDTPTVPLPEAPAGARSTV